jgi:hypothetical protein
MSIIIQPVQSTEERAAGSEQRSERTSFSCLSARLNGRVGSKQQTKKCVALQESQQKIYGLSQRKVLYSQVRAHREFLNLRSVVARASGLDVSLWLPEYHSLTACRAVARLLPILFPALLNWTQHHLEHGVPAAIRVYWIGRSAPTCLAALPTPLELVLIYRSVSRPTQHKCKDSAQSSSSSRISRPYQRPSCPFSFLSSASNLTILLYALSTHVWPAKVP